MPLAEAVYTRLDAAALLKTRGPKLAALLRSELPELDPKDSDFVAEFLGEWTDDALARVRLLAACRNLELPLPAEAPGASDEMEEGQPAAAKPVADPEAARCLAVLVALQELTDEQWAIPDGADTPVDLELPFASKLTGQPLIGSAFADSVTRSLRVSTLVSLGALALLLLVTRQIRALVPAVWTLAVTAGVVWLLGHPISIGTSMVSCIALGAGVDFAIHLGIRAREVGGSQGGTTATRELGGVVGMAGLQLALAFGVLLASSMPPLREFGAGLAVALLLAAIGSVWLTPRLYDKR